MQAVISRIERPMPSRTLRLAELDMLTMALNLAGQPHHQPPPTHRNGVTSPIVAFDRYIVDATNDTPYSGPIIPKLRQSD